MGASPSVTDRGQFAKVNLVDGKTGVQAQGIAAGIQRNLAADSTAVEGDFSEISIQLAASHFRREGNRADLVSGRFDAADSATSISASTLAQGSKVEGFVGDTLQRVAAFAGLGRTLRGGLSQHAGAGGGR